MKRNENKVPEFDEIIFENRNKTYGAYDIRKHYNSATSISILGGVILCTILVVALSLNTGEVIAGDGPTSVVITIGDPVIPEITLPPEPEVPAEVVKADPYVAPVVTSDTTVKISDLQITDDYLDVAKDGLAKDSLIVAEYTDPVIPAEEKVFIVVQESPEYPGGLSELMKDINENISYPSDAVEKNIQGRVILKFVVNKDGSIDRIETLRSIDPLLDAEATRVVGKLKKFRPGKQGGVAVPVWFTLPVLFRLENK
jgi:protein TonB